MSPRNRWDDEYDSYQDDQPTNRTLSVDPLDDSLYFEDARYDA